MATVGCSASKRVGAAIELIGSKLQYSGIERQKTYHMYSKEGIQGKANLWILLQTSKYQIKISSNKVLFND